MKSMTGYGSAQSGSGPSQIEVNIRSVNGRFLETRFHLPREFHPFEAALKKIIEEHFQRGTVDIYVSRKIKSESVEQKVLVNEKLATQYLKAFQKIAKDLKLKSAVTAEALARLPEVLRVESETEVSASEKKSLMSTFQKACVACAEERKREGKSLKADFEKNLSKLDSAVEGVSELREEANTHLMERFESKLKARLQGVELDSARISQEVVLQLEKSDINEELTRLREHLKNYRGLLGASEPIGKKLEFYTQELLREVNTIGSKSNLSKLTQIVVDAKTNIERLREQVQNLE